MIKIRKIKAWGTNTEEFFIVGYEDNEFKQLNTYLTLINCNPWEDWKDDSGGIWNSSWGKELQAEFYKEKLCPWNNVPWNKKYENVIHEYNNLFYPDQLCESDDKDTV